jgi:hypothetical protein
VGLCAGVTALATAGLSEHASIVSPGTLAGLHSLPVFYNT